MKITIYVLLFICWSIAACTPNDKQQQANPSLQNTLLNEGSTQENNLAANTDTLVVTQNAAVFYEPDSLQMERRKKEVGEENFYIGADDYLFYLNETYEYLEKENLPILLTQNKKYVKFVGADSKATLIKLDTLSELWGVFFFDIKKAPQQVDMTMIEEEYKSYYQ